jgi:hypothetical protein
LHKFQTIILGDFNSNLQRNDTTSKLLHTLQKSGLQSSLKTFEINTATWKRSNSSSQIDNIWIPQSITHSFLPPTIIDATNLTDSDHKIISIEWCINPFNRKKHRRSSNKRLIFKYEEMNKDMWSDYSQEIDGKVSKLMPTITPITNITSLDKA